MVMLQQLDDLLLKLCNSSDKYDFVYFPPAYLFGLKGLIYKTYLVLFCMYIFIKLLFCQFDVVVVDSHLIFIINLLNVLQSFH